MLWYENLTFEMHKCVNLRAKERAPTIVVIGAEEVKSAYGFRGVQKEIEKLAECMRNTAQHVQLC